MNTDNIFVMYLMVAQPKQYCLDKKCIYRAYLDTLRSRREKKMMKRSRHVIVSQILDICKDGANKTKIVYQANLNFRTVNPYINLLVKNNLIEVKEGKNIVYETTNKGKHLLDDFKQINSQLY